MLYFNCLKKEMDMLANDEKRPSPRQPGDLDAIRAQAALQKAPADKKQDELWGADAGEDQGVGGGSDRDPSDWDLLGSSTTVGSDFDARSDLSDPGDLVPEIEPLRRRSSPQQQGLATASTPPPKAAPVSQPPIEAAPAAVSTTPPHAQSTETVVNQPSPRLFSASSKLTSRARSNEGDKAMLVDQLEASREARRIIVEELKHLDKKIEGLEAKLRIGSRMETMEC